MLAVEAEPYEFQFPFARTALLVIDMQRDFLLEGGFGQIQGGSLEAVQSSIAPTARLLNACRQAGLAVFHTREGQKPDLSDCPSSKLHRQAAAPGESRHCKVIGEKGEMGRLLVRGEYGQDIIDELQPRPSEVVIDKPGKGAFWNTSLMDRLKAKSVTHLIVSGVTTECCFATTIREANDRGFECCGIEEATAGYNEEFKSCSLRMLHWSQGLFGFVAKLESFIRCLTPYISTTNTCASTTPPHTPPSFNGDLGIANLQESYRHGLSPVTVVEEALSRIEKYTEIDPAVWIYREPRQSVLEQARQLQSKWPHREALPPLFGVPFSVKDSIDIAGLPTTTACPPLAQIPSLSARSYQTIISQGAIFVGKTNLDQLATGLTGCRSPYGITRSVFSRDHISGGSSSGSCVSVGAGLVSFSLATDTAGSGRVPSGFNGVVGFKPTRGLISAHGVTPACLSLDCIALIATCVEDARTVWNLSVQFDEADRYAKVCAPILQRHVNSLGPQANSFKFGIPPPEALAICCPSYRSKFNHSVQMLQRLGGQLQLIDWAPFEKAGKLLYEGSFVYERLASLPDDWLEQNLGSLHPVIETIFSNVVARKSSAVDIYRDLQARALYLRQVEKVFEYSACGVDVLVVPTTPKHWTVEEVLGNPIETNSVLGEFTHFGNVLDLCAIAVPAGTCVESSESAASNKRELPFSVTFLGGSRMDAEILVVAERFERAFKGMA
ncbi:MAG: hypothetical protein Q9191_005123 [Dirinaria sp. TL-2023a]